MNMLDHISVSRKIKTQKIRKYTVVVGNAKINTRIKLKNKELLGEISQNTYYRLFKFWYKWNISW